MILKQGEKRPINIVGMHEYASYNVQPSNKWTMFPFFISGLLVVYIYNGSVSTWLDNMWFLCVKFIGILITLRHSFAFGPVKFIQYYWRLLPIAPKTRVLSNHVHE